VTTRPIPYRAASGLSFRAAPWPARNARALADPQTAPISALLPAAAERELAIAECVAILARRECSASRPAITATRSPGE